MIVSLVVLVLLLAQGADGAAQEIGPEGEWCEAARRLSPGQELVLRPGEYQGPCTIRRGGTREAPVVIRAKDPRQPPRIVYAGQSDNVINIRADHVTLRGLQFGPTLPSVDGVRIVTGSDITIEDCRFVELGGIAVVANHTSVRRIIVRGNEIHRSGATAMYFGCHDGLHCTATALLIEQNYINGVQAPDAEIGYGIQLKLNSTARIRDNVILNTKGPGIMVYGAQGSGQASVVERNFTAGSRTSSGLVIGGGPVVVRNNVSITNATAGIGLEDYAQRGLLRGVIVVHNTVYGNGEGGIRVPPHGPLEASIVNNAAHARPGTPPFPRGRLGVLSIGNLDCTELPCFLNPHDRDFSPLAIGPGSLAAGEWAPREDYFGRPRGVPPAIGAIEQPAGPIPLAIKAMPR